MLKPQPRTYTLNLNKFETLSCFTGPSQGSARSKARITLCTYNYLQTQWTFQACAKAQQKLKLGRRWLKFMASFLGSKHHRPFAEDKPDCDVHVPNLINKAAGSDTTLQSAHKDLLAAKRHSWAAAWRHAHNNWRSQTSWNTRSILLWHEFDIYHC